jgi:exodeoxyribonuclease-3
MKIATWNVNGIRARQSQFAEWVETETPDVVCVQELKAKKEQIPETCGLPEYTCYWHGVGAYSGVGLHVRGATFAAPEIRFSHPPFDMETRIVQAEVGDLVFASVYVPNGGKDFPAKIAFLKELEGYVGDVHGRGKQLVLCGDLNVARTERDVHPKERKPNAIGQLPEERELLERIIGRGLVDVGRALDPDNDELFTWWAPWRNLRQRNIGWRLDYVLASEPLARSARSCRVDREFGTSDHGPVVAVFD